MHTEKPIFTAQFHPEAFGGPTDTEVKYTLSPRPARTIAFNSRALARKVHAAEHHG